MSLKLVLSPFSLPGFYTKISFKTAQVAAGKTLILLDTTAEIPDVTVPNDKSIKCILTIIDRIIADEASLFFRRPVDPIIDTAENYLDVIKTPIDLGLIRKRALSGIYTNFSDFVADIRLLITNATIFNPLSHKVHQKALALSFILRDILIQLNANYEDLIKNPNEKIADTLIAESMAKFQSAKKEKERARKASAETVKKVVQKNTMKLSATELESLASKIKKLSSSALVGVVEILTKGDFTIDRLPLDVDLDRVDHQTLSKLNTYVESCSKDDTKPALYAWRPFEPKELLSIQEQYAAELLSWKAAPPDPLD